MDQPKTIHMDLEEFAARSDEVVESIRQNHERVVVTIDGRAAVVMLDMDTYQALNEGQPGAADPAYREYLMVRQGIQRGLDDANRGAVVTLDDLLAELDREFPHLKA